MAVVSQVYRCIKSLTEKVERTFYLEMVLSVHISHFLYLPSSVIPPMGILHENRPFGSYSQCHSHPNQGKVRKSSFLPNSKTRANFRSRQPCRTSTLLSTSVVLLTSLAELHSTLPALWKHGVEFRCRISSFPTGHVVYWPLASTLSVHSLQRQRRTMTKRQACPIYGSLILSQAS